MITTGQSYTFKVTAVNSAGESNPADEQTFICAELPLAPSQAYRINSTIVNIHFGWTFPISDGGSEVTNYEIWYKRISHDESSWSLLTTTSLNLNDYDHTGLRELNTNTKFEQNISRLFEFFSYTRFFSALCSFS